MDLTFFFLFLNNYYFFFRRPKHFWLCPILLPEEVLILFYIYWIYKFPFIFHIDFFRNLFYALLPLKLLPLWFSW